MKSPRYAELIGQYRQLHEKGTPYLSAEDTFPGFSMARQADTIGAWIRQTGARSILDYGSGKGRQYAMPIETVDGQWPDMKTFWGVDSITCYDPAYEPFSKLPEGKFDGVICTDVLEHCPETDIPWILGEIFGFARLFVFANVACYPAKKSLPNGENAHCTIRPRFWWEALIRKSAPPGLSWEFRIRTPETESCLKHTVAAKPQ